MHSECDECMQKVTHDLTFNSGDRFHFRHVCQDHYLEYERGDEISGLCWDDLVSVRVAL